MSSIGTLAELKTNILQMIGVIDGCRIGSAMWGHAAYKLPEPHGQVRVPHSSIGYDLRVVMLQKEDWKNFSAA